MSQTAHRSFSSSITSSILAFHLSFAHFLTTLCPGRITLTQSHYSTQSARRSYSYSLQLFPFSRISVSSLTSISRNKFSSQHTPQQQPFVSIITFSLSTTSHSLVTPITTTISPHNNNNVQYTLLPLRLRLVPQTHHRAMHRLSLPSLSMLWPD